MSLLLHAIHAFVQPDAAASSTCDTQQTLAILSVQHQIAEMLIPSENKIEYVMGSPAGSAKPMVGCKALKEVG